MASPVSKVNFGDITLAVWENSGKTKDGKEFVTQSITIQKNYKKDDKWQSTNSLKDSDLMYVILACQQRLIDKYKRDEPDEIEL